MEAMEAIEAEQKRRLKLGKTGYITRARKPQTRHTFGKSTKELGDATQRGKPKILNTLHNVGNTQKLNTYVLKRRGNYCPIVKYVLNT